MDVIRLRLNEFCSLIPDAEKQTVRSIIARDEAPFPADPEDGKQRTYGPTELLAWALYTQLRNMGIPAKFAAEVIRINHIVDQVFKAFERGDDLADLFLVVDRHEKRGASGEARSIWGVSLQPSGGMIEILTQGAASFGTKNLLGETRLGLSGATIVPIKPCFERTEAALDAAGFLMNGQHLHEKE